MGEQYCAASFEQCDQYNDDCTCRAAYVDCLVGLQCPFQVVYEAISACENSGCPSSECNPLYRVSSSRTATPQPSPSPPGCTQPAEDEVSYCLLLAVVPYCCLETGEEGSEEDEVVLCDSGLSPAVTLTVCLLICPLAVLHSDGGLYGPRLQLRLHGCICGMHWYVVAAASCVSFAQRALTLVVCVCLLYATELLNCPFNDVQQALTVCESQGCSLQQCFDYTATASPSAGWIFSTSPSVSASASSSASASQTVSSSSSQ
jgi:hypothetical protein